MYIPPKCPKCNEQLLLVETTREYLEYNPELEDYDIVDKETVITDKTELFCNNPDCDYNSDKK